MTTLTQAYIDNQLIPYVIAMNDADSLQALQGWIPLIITDPHLQQAATSVANTDIETARTNFTEFLGNILVEGALAQTGNYSPWEIARGKTPLAEQLFGPHSDTIAVVVVTPSNVFTHDLTEEQVFGIIVGLQAEGPYPEIQLFVGAHSTEMEDVLSWQQTTRQTPMTYKMSYRDIIITFQTSNFIQGVITGLGWRGTNLQALGVMVYEVTGAGDQLITIS